MRVRGSGTVLVVAAVAVALTVPVGAAQAVPQPALVAVDDATASLDGMTLEQRVGQVFMVGTPATGIAPSTLSAVRDRHVGSVMLTGRSTAGVQTTAGVTARLRSLVTPASTAATGLLVATDQEGGRVQVLQGPGFSAIPSARVQGRSDPGVLRGSAAAWGRQLRAAGVNTDFAPVMDTVPSPAAAATNPPIGVYDREYGYTPAAVGSHGTAVAQGLADAGVVATAKHFPGLGRVTGNTDTTAGVTDRVTTRTDPYLAPFATALRSGTPMLMMSTAYYARIDPAHPAAFSPTVVQGMVRGDLGFQGVVVSDDLANARQVAAWSPGDRALQFLSAGGDLVLTVGPGQLPAMYDAVLARARADAPLRARVQEAALRVLRVKQARGLLPRGGLGAIGATYEALGGPRSFVGSPITPQYPIGAGVEQDFTGAVILWSPATGAHVVLGGILLAYRAQGGPLGPLGFPTTGELGGPDGVSRHNDFAGPAGVGSVYWAPATEAHAVYGAVRARWAALGLTTGPLGLPTTDEKGSPDGIGRYNEFRGYAGAGTVWWTPATGAHAMYGGILAAYRSVGGPAGRLGYPVADEADAPGGRVSVFAHGRIVWRAADGAVTITYS